MPIKSKKLEPDKILDSIKTNLLLDLAPKAIYALGQCEKVEIFDNDFDMVLRIGIRGHTHIDVILESTGSIAKYGYDGTIKLWSYGPTKGEWLLADPDYESKLLKTISDNKNILLERK